MIGDPAIFAGTELKFFLSIAVALFHCWKAHLRIVVVLSDLAADILLVFNWAIFAAAAAAAAADGLVDVVGFVGVSGDGDVGVGAVAVDDKNKSFENWEAALAIFEVNSFVLDFLSCFL